MKTKKIWKNTDNCASFSENSSNIDGPLKGTLGNNQNIGVNCRQFCLGKNEGRRKNICTPMCHKLRETGGKLERRGTRAQGVPRTGVNRLSRLSGAHLQKNQFFQIFTHNDGRVLKVCHGGPPQKQKCQRSELRSAQYVGKRSHSQNFSHSHSPAAVQ